MFLLFEEYLCHTISINNRLITNNNLYLYDYLYDWFAHCRLLGHSARKECSLASPASKRKKVVRVWTAPRPRKPLGSSPCPRGAWSSQSTWDKSELRLTVEDGLWECTNVRACVCTNSGLVWRSDTTLTRRNRKLAIVIHFRPFFCGCAIETSECKCTGSDFACRPRQFYIWMLFLLELAQAKGTDLVVDIYRICEQILFIFCKSGLHD